MAMAGEACPALVSPARGGGMGQYRHVQQSRMSAKFLVSNATSHRHPFGAIAELVDNAVDAGVNATQFIVDSKEVNGKTCLVLMDNGPGIDQETLSRMLGFGFNDKDNKCIGQYGNGFKSGSMRIADDALVFTKCKKTRSVGFLSQTFLREEGIEDVLIPMVTWDNRDDTRAIGLTPEEASESLAAITKYSVFESEETLLQQMTVLDHFSGDAKTGTIIVLFNLREDHGTPELDFTSRDHDIMHMADECEAERLDKDINHSLRAYLSVLYKVPRMQIFLRGSKVRSSRIAGVLSHRMIDKYTPRQTDDGDVSGAMASIELGLTTVDPEHNYGFMLYHRNRLIVPYLKLGIQNEQNERGAGVLGVVEADFLKVAHNKQNFIDTTVYRALTAKLKTTLSAYWSLKEEREKKEAAQQKVAGAGAGPSRSRKEVRPDVMWVQCDYPSCLKWRTMPKGSKAEDLPSTWYCYMNPNPRYNTHEAPEEEWNEEVNMIIETTGAKPLTAAEARATVKRQQELEEEHAAPDKRARTEASQDTHDVADGGGAGAGAGGATMELPPPLPAAEAMSPPRKWTPAAAAAYAMANGNATGGTQNGKAQKQLCERGKLAVQKLREVLVRLASEAKLEGDTMAAGLQNLDTNDVLDMDVTGLVDNLLKRIRDTPTAAAAAAAAEEVPATGAPRTRQRRVS